MDHPPPAPEAEPPAHHPAPPGGQQPPPHTIPNILLADLTGTAHGSVVLTSTQRGVWGHMVGCLKDADREQLRKVCKTTAAVEHVQAWLPRWIEVLPPEEEEEGDEDEGSKDEDEEPEEEDEGDEEDEDENEEVDAGGPTPGANLVVMNLAVDGISTTLKDALAAFKRFRTGDPTRRFEIRLGDGAHKTGFQVVNHHEDIEDNDEDDLPGFVGGGGFRGLSLEGGGWDGLRIKTPEVCAVYGQAGLASVAVLEGVQTIRAEAFWGCSSLASVAFPDSLQTIEWRAFSGCSSLASAAFPASTSVVSSAFAPGCKIVRAIKKNLL